MHQPSKLAIDILSTYQQQAIEDYGLVFTVEAAYEGTQLAATLAQFKGVFSKEEADRWSHTVIKQFEQARTLPRPTPHQDPLDQAILSNALMTLEQRISKISNARLPERIVLGSLPIGQMNAITIHVAETDEYLILFQRGLFGLLNLLARIVASVWPSGPPGQGLPLVVKREELEQNLKQDPNASRHLLAVLDRSLIHGNPHSVPVLPLRPPQQGMKETILLNAEMFVLGHEFGHIERGHFQAPRQVAAKCGNQALTITSRTHQEEFAADLTGFQYVTAFGTLDPVQLCLSYFGACFFLSCQELVEDALVLMAGLNDGKRARDTHPDGARRREALTNILASEIGHEPSRLVASSYEAIQWVLDEVWRQAKGDWARTSEAGVEASPIWTAAVESQQRPADDVGFQVDPPDKTTKALGMPSLREMDDLKGSAFVALLDLVSTESDCRREAAAWVLESAHIIVFSVLSELAYGPPERRDGFVAYLVKCSPEMTHWISDFQFTVSRHAGNEDMAGVPEVMIYVTTSMEYLREIAQRVLRGEHVDHARLLFEVVHSVNQRFFGKKGS